MKVIITEEQLDKMKSKLMGLVNRDGFDETAKMLGISKIKLFKLVDFDFKDFGLENMFAIMVEENYENNVYKDCEITIDYFESGFRIDWLYEIDIDGSQLFVLSFATPDFYDGSVYVENSQSFTEGSIGFKVYNNGLEYKVKESNFDIPTDFDSIDDMVNWFNNKYLPKTYEIMKKQAKEIIKQI